MAATAYVDTKANIEALPGPTEGDLAVTTDTDELGFYIGGVWVWVEEDAIHDNIASEISAVAEKTALVAADMLLIEDSAAANAKKMVQLSNVPPQDMSVLATKNAVQAINNGTHTALVWQTELFDTDSMHDTGSNTNRLVAPKAGKYLVLAGIEWASNATNDRMFYFRDQDANVLATVVQGPSGAGGASQQVFALVNMATSDWVEALVYQSSGGVLNVLDTDDRTFFGMCLVGEV